MKRIFRAKAFGILLMLVMVFVSYIAMPAKALAEEAERIVLAENIEQYAAANDFSQDNTLAYSPLVGELREERGKHEGISQCGRRTGSGHLQQADPLLEE